jgi:hypothetical protein
VDSEGKPLDFLKRSRKRLQKAICANLDDNHSMPAENAFALFNEYLLNPTDKEKKMHDDWDRIVLSRADKKAYEQLCRLAAGWLPISERPKGRSTGEKPPLWDFMRSLPV